MCGSMLRVCQECEERFFGAMCAPDSPLSTLACRQEVYLTRPATSVDCFTSPVSSSNTYPQLLLSSEAEIWSESQLELKVGKCVTGCGSVGTVLDPILVPDLSFISARWTESELSERERERERERETRGRAPLVHWADRGYRV